MKIKLIYPNPDSKDKLYGRRAHSAALQLLAAITPKRHDVTIVEEHLGGDFEYNDHVDLVGITSMTIQSARAYAIADEYRRRGVKVVLGGIHPSVVPEEAMQHADAVVVGEAELLWETVLNDFGNNIVKGIYRSNNLVDMKRIPPYRRDVFKKGTSFSLAQVQATRGCPYDCSFCSAHLFSGRKYRFRPVENVIAEIKALKEKVIFFLDDNIFANSNYSGELFTELKKLNKIWVGQASMRLTVNNPGLLKLAQESGCSGLFIGVESISGKSLKEAGAFKKNTAASPRDIATALRIIHDHGIIIMAGIIFGFDNDDIDVFDRTTEFLTENKVALSAFSTLTPFPGTKIFETMRAQNRILSYDWSQYDTNNAVFRPKLMGPEQLREGTIKAGVKFYSGRNIFKKFFTNSRHPFYYSVLAFSARHSCRTNNNIPFYMPSR
jgi:radical SAM superfamily enzyme YgiQ (UPF0313 family)